MSPHDLQRWSLVVLGSVLTAIGLVGVVLPLVPTTPFLLLAAACFARSSERLHRLLLSNRVLGPYLEEWRLHRRVAPAAKRKAYLLVVLGFGVSIAVVEVLWVRAGLVALGLAVLIFLRRLPS